MRSQGTRWRAGAARHDAVVEMLERVLLAKALVPGRDERHAGHAGRHQCAPGGRPAMGVHDIAAAPPHQIEQPRGVARERERTASRHVEAHELGARLRQARLEPPAGGRNDRTVARADEHFGQGDCALIGGADLDGRHRDQHRQGTCGFLCRIGAGLDAGRHRRRQRRVRSQDQASTPDECLTPRRLLRLRFWAGSLRRHVAASMRCRRTLDCGDAPSNAAWGQCCGESAIVLPRW